MGFWQLWLEPLKLLVILACQFVSALIAIALLGASTDTQIKTSGVLDCLNTPTPAACVIYPELGLGATQTSLGWQEALGAMIIYGTYVAGERYFGFAEKAEILGSALLFAVGHFIVYVQWQTPSGGSFNFWFWSISSWFSGKTDNAGLYIWPAILGIALVALTEIVFYYVYMYYLRRVREDGEDEEEYKDK